MLQKNLSSEIPQLKYWSTELNYENTEIQSVLHLRTICLLVLYAWISENNSEIVNILLNVRDDECIINVIPMRICFWKFPQESVGMHTM